MRKLSERSEGIRGERFQNTNDCLCPKRESLRTSPCNPQTDADRQTQTDIQRRTHGFTQLRRADVDVSPPLLFSACSLLSVHYLSLESAPSVRSPFLFGGLSGSAGPVNDQSFFDLRVTKWQFSCVFCLCFRGCFSPSTSVANAFFAAEKNSREIRKR
ncbi:hypothetical protein TGRUB_365560 [Toxoplasma gondii RUB]|uniref:Uncharacterized protein n=2 Tax=Toxoplasma gondii TaxID=5811 RepID=A0A086LN72_TOXGO|nr:hypothetical protein TGRUB_365560 [Toxoplasma gondii RUB]KFG99701.1 hypothetical protein TGVAND_365560 [Toxoplasma gondii VAND]